MIFAIFKTYKDIKRGTADPAGFGQEMLLDVFKVPLILFTIIGSVVLILLFILGWTNILLNSLGIFKVLFFLIFIPFLILEIIFWSIFGRIKKLTGKAKEKVNERLKAIDAEIER
ncbi:MAG: hypothetical protein IT284_00805 [Bacteroidetes bacterium]|nr:hypothetical protein [Bacteroidota bacterium]